MREAVGSGIRAIVSRWRSSPSGRPAGSWLGATTPSLNGPLSPCGYNPRVETTSEPDWHARMREWCRGITLRLLPANAISYLRYDSLGTPMRALIARDPEEFEELPNGVSLRERLCPVCRTMTEPPDNSLRASVELDFGKFTIARFVWVHAQCFSQCVETGEQRGIPW
jgi:hypothetical protein